MPMDVELQHFRAPLASDRVYPPDILPMLQSLLADLADLDLACERMLETVERSPARGGIEHQEIAALWQLYHDRREPYVAALRELQKRCEACFGP